MKSLFGDDIPETPIHQRRDKAHAAAPGTGPAGKTCGDCAHLTRVRMANVYRKCALMEPYWTNGPGTDIRCKDAACRSFEEDVHHGDVQ